MDLRKIDAPGYTLRAENLASKWGFGDGDGLQDYLYDLRDEGALAALPDRDEFLYAVVVKYLVPELERCGVQVKLYMLSSNHNPVRAESVNGVEVDEYKPETCPEALKGIEVFVPREALLAMAKGVEVE